MPQLNIKQVKGSTQGSVLFLGANARVSENNSQFYWDVTNNALLIGTTSQFGTEKLRVNGSQRIDGNLVVTGSFSVLGSASVINTQNLTIQDPIILLASTQSGSPILDSGFFINRGTGATQAFIWDESADEFVFIQTNDSSTVIGDVNISSYANIRANGATFTQVKITSGASNGYILISDSVGLASWTSSSNLSINVNNGLTYSGGIVQLGGPLIRDTLITNSIYAFTMSTTASNINFNRVTVGTTYSIQVDNTNAKLESRTNTEYIQAKTTDSNTSLRIGPNAVGLSGDSIVLWNFDQTLSSPDGSTNNRLTVTDTTYSKGLVYAGDYTANFTTFSLVTKGYVNANGGLSTANNGLTYSGSNVKLGGALIQDTLIVNSTNAFTMSSTSNISFYSSSPGGQISKVATDPSFTTLEMYDFGGGTGYVNIKLYSSPQTIGDGSTNNQAIIKDQQQLKGLVYDADYSANFTTYSLVTKGYVQSITGTAANGVTGSGVANYIPYWTSANHLSSTSSIIDSGNEIGIGTQSNATYKVSVQGDVNILGTLYATSKSFEITHPLDPTKRLTYGSLEGPEYGVYYRGKLERNNIIDLPDYWTGLVDESSITVNITPIGLHQRIFVEKIENNKVYLGVDNSGPPNCYYIVYAERKDIPKIIVE